MKNFTAKHVLVIIALCGVLGNFLGVLYNLAGLFYAPVADGLGVGRGNVAMAQTIANLCAAAGALLTTRFTRSEKCNYKVFVLVCGAVYTASTALLAACNSMMPMYALSVLRGLASGCAGTFFVTLVIGNWFEGTTGFLTSLVFCSSGLVGAVFSPVLSSVIENSGWRSGYLAMAAVIAGLYLPSLLLPIRYRPQDCGCLPAYIGKESASVSEQKETAASTYTAVMFGFAMIYCVLSSCETQYVGHLPGIADSYGMTAAVGSAMLSIAMMTNTFGKLVFGALTDKVGVEKGIYTYALLVTAGTVFLMTLRSTGAMYLAAGLIGLCYPLSSVGSVLICKELFKDRYSDTYPKINAATTFCSAVVASGVGFIYDAFGSYTPALVILLVGIAVQVAATFIAFRSARKNAMA